MDGSPTLMELLLWCKREGLVPLDQAEAKTEQSRVNQSLNLGDSEVVETAMSSAEGNDVLGWVPALAWHTVGALIMTVNHSPNKPTI